ALLDVWIGDLSGSDPVAPDPFSPATGAPMIYDLRDADRGEDLHGEPAGLLRGRQAFLPRGARPLRGGPRIRGARPVGAGGSGEVRRGARVAVRAREGGGGGQAEPRDWGDKSGGDGPRRGGGRGAGGARGRQRHGG